MAVLRRSPLDAAVAVLVPLALLLFTLASGSVAGLVQSGLRGRWVALAALAAVALLRAFLRRSARPRSLPFGWAVAALLLVLCLESALWSVDPRRSAERAVALAVLFATGALLALGDRDAGRAATLVIGAVLAGVALVALAGLVELAVDHRAAVQSATSGAGWRFRGIGGSPDTVPLLLAVGLPIAVWWAAAARGRARLAAVALVLLFAAELGLSGSRGGLVAAFIGALVTVAVVALPRRSRALVAAAVIVLGLAAVAVSRLPSPAAPNAAAKPSGQQAPVIVHRGLDAKAAFPQNSELGYPTGPYQPPGLRTLFGASGRVQAWDGALHQGLQRPVAGYGFGTEATVFTDRFYVFDSAYVENTYLGLFLQLGAVGVALFVALLLALAVRGAALARRMPRGPAAACLGVLAATALLGVSQSALLTAGNLVALPMWLCVLPLAVVGWERA